MSRMEVQPPRRYLLWCGGIAAGATWLALRCSLPVGILVLAGALGGVILCIRWARPLAALAAVAAVFLIMGFGCRYRYEALAAPLDGAADTVTGQIRERRTGSWYVLRITRSDRLPDGTRVLLYCPDAAAPEVYDTIAATVTYQVFRDNGDRYRADRICLQALPTGYGEAALTVTGSSGASPGRIWALERQALSNRLRRRLPGQEGAVLAAMCLGDDRYLTEETRQAFRSCGLPHLLVVSGLHLSVIIGAVYLLAHRLRLPRRLTVGLTAAVLLLYSGLVGFSPSVCRAGAMVLVLLAGQWLRRPADGLNSMGLALCGILLCNPYALYDVGLQLSFSAAGGILALTPRLMALTAPPVERHPWLRPVQAGLCTTLGASLLLSPFLAGHFGTLSWISPVANLIAVPVAGVLLILGCVTVLCLGCPPLCWCGQSVGFLAGWLARLLRGVCRLLEQETVMLTVPAGSWRFWWLTVSCVALALLLYYRPAWAGRAAGLAAAMLLLIFLGERLIAAEGYTVRVTGAGEAAAVLVQQDDRALLLVQNGDACAVARQLWQQRGITGSTVIAVGDGSTADAAAIAELRRTTGAAVVLSGETADWALGQAEPVYETVPGQPLELWEGLTLARLSGGWWYVELADTTLLLSPPADAFAPEKFPERSADGVVISGEIVYNACWTTAAQSVWVCTRSQRQGADALPQQPSVTVTDTPAALYTRGQGDWRKRL